MEGEDRTDGQGGAAGVAPRDDALRRYRCPRLAGDLCTFAMPDGLGVQVRGGPTTVLLRGRQAEPVLGFLLRALDGRRTLDEALAERPQEISAEALLRTLRSLDAKGLLVDGEAPRESGAEALRDEVRFRQLLFWGRKLGVTRRDHQATSVERRIEAAHVVLVGTGLLGAATYDLLTRSGVRSIDVLAWDDAGILRDSVAASPVAPRALASPQAVSVDAAAAHVRGWAEGADLLLTATRNGPASLFWALNRIALDLRCPWLRANESASELDIGPYVHPYESSCYTCMSLRETSTLERPVEERLYQEHLADERPAGRTAPLGESVAAASLGASLIVLEALRILTLAARPTALDAVLSVSPLQGLSRTHRILRVPRCPDCGSPPGHG